VVRWRYGACGRVGMCVCARARVCVCVRVCAGVRVCGWVRVCGVWVGVLVLVLGLGGSGWRFEARRTPCRS
jgi:hypothetical protein